jgi:hypothetical protein
MVSSAPGVLPSAVMVMVRLVEWGTGDRGTTAVVAGTLGVTVYAPSGVPLPVSCTAISCRPLALPIRTVIWSP